MNFFTLISKLPIDGLSNILENFPNSSTFLFDTSNSELNGFLTTFFIFEAEMPKKTINKKTSETIIGRVIFNAKEIFQEEFKLKNYKLSTVFFDCFDKNLIELSQDTLLEFSNNGQTWRIIEYIFNRIIACELILKKINYWDMASEFSRLYGITLRNIDRG